MIALVDWYVLEERGGGGGLSLKKEFQSREHFRTGTQQQFQTKG